MASSTLLAMSAFTLAQAKLRKSASDTSKVEVRVPQDSHTRRRQMQEFWGRLFFTPICPPHWHMLGGLLFMVRSEVDVDNPGRRGGFRLGLLHFLEALLRHPFAGCLKLTSVQGGRQL